MLLHETGSVLSFSFLTLSNEGQYSCEITLNSQIFTADWQVAIKSKLKSHIYVHYPLIINVFV